MKFRYDINALRAIAVIGVVLFHFKVPFLDGGFAGVDIFYVISGFLMTKIVMNSLEANTFSLGEFYMKRVKRIVPALFFLILPLLIIGFFIYLPNDYQILTKNATASLLFVSNILYWKDSNYFHPSSETNVLLHTWSLSVEWQFYLILPIIIALLYRFFSSNRNKYLFFFGGITFLIFILSVWYNKKDPTASFYLLPTRSWEMLAGGIAVFFTDLKNVWIKKTIAIVSYIALFLCILLLDSHLRWPGVYTSLPVFATFLIIVANINDFKILQNNVVQWAGKLSYSLYLWHWPVYVIANYLGVEQGPITTSLLILLSVGLAYISFKYIESYKFNGRNILIYTSSLCVLAGVFSYTNPNKLLFNENTLAISRYSDTHEEEKDIQFGTTDSCFISSGQTGLKDYSPRYCLDIKTDKKNILLLGDSHAAHFSQSIREALEKENIHLIQASASGCLPTVKKNGETRCNEIIDYIYSNYLPKNAEHIDGVILSANWSNVDKNGFPSLSKNLQETITYLDSLHIKSIIIGQNETYTIPFPSIVAREYQYNVSISNQYLNKEAEHINQFLGQKLGTSYVDIYKIGLSEKLSTDHIPYMFDQNHFTKHGADNIISSIFLNKNFENFLTKSNANFIGFQAVN